VLFSRTTTMENNSVQAEQLCFITVCFPVGNDDQIISVKKKVFEAVKELPRVKTELRISEMRNVDGRS